MALAARRAGYEVRVVTRVDKLESLGFRLHAVDWRRGSIDPFAFLNSVRAVRRYYRAIAPDLIHHVALQPTIVGSLAASGLASVRLNALTQSRCPSARSGFVDLIGDALPRMITISAVSIPA